MEADAEAMKDQSQKVHGLHAVGSLLQRDPTRVTLLHVDAGRQDRRMQELLEHARQAGVPVRKIVYPGVGHGRTVAAFSGLGDDLPVVDDVESFVGDIVGREPRQFEARRASFFGEAG